jgi:LAS superfamily LD-carboxypeptidase LdcB
MTKNNLQVALPVVALLALIISSGTGLLFWTHQGQSQDSVGSLSAELASTTVALETLRASFLQDQQVREAKLLELSDGLYQIQQHMGELSETFEDVEGDVKKLSGSVDDLEKLSATDPELLQKYSRIYFLNEHYIPADLEPLQEQYDFVNGKEVTVHADMLPFLEDLLDEAREDGVSLLVLSGYRSYAEQTTLKDNYLVRYGTGANTFSADQGYSEHQLGTTVDFTDQTNGEFLQGFEGTKAFTWLKANAYKYGFVMSYPENNEYYIYEPWHWRFVGKDLARYLHRNNKDFYDLEQRTIDTYLGSLFD